MVLNLKRNLQSQSFSNAWVFYITGCSSCEIGKMHISIFCDILVHNSFFLPYLKITINNIGFMRMRFRGKNEITSFPFATDPLTSDKEAIEKSGNNI